MGHKSHIPSDEHSVTELVELGANGYCQLCGNLYTEASGTCCGRRVSPVALPVGNLVNEVGWLALSDQMELFVTRDLTRKNKPLSERYQLAQDYLDSDAAHIVAVMTETPVLGQRRAIEGYFRREAAGRL